MSDVSRVGGIGQMKKRKDFQSLKSSRMMMRIVPTIADRAGGQFPAIAG